MTFKNLKEIVDADENGFTRTFSFRKAPSQTTGVSVWQDLSMSPGNPVPNYYAASPLIPVAMRQSTDGGIFHGANVSPKTKHLRKITILSTADIALPIPFILMDYLLYYPFCDDGSTDEQMMLAGASLPRYSSGDGVKIMVVSVAPRTGTQPFTIKYTNSEGITGRVTQTAYQASPTANGTILTCGFATNISNMLFMGLQSGDSGVRSIESITMGGLDVGLSTIVLVKPIANFCLNEQTAAVEVDFLTDRGLSLPKIEDDAYLNLACLTNGNIATTQFIGDIKVTWN
jgi:hypothetical protein